MPLLLESQLLKALDITAYSTQIQVSVKRSSAMTLEGEEMRSKRDILYDTGLE